MKKAVFATLTVCLIVVGIQAWAEPGDPVEIPTDPLNLLVSNLFGDQAFELDMFGSLQAALPFLAEGSGGIDVGGPNGNVFLGHDASGTVSEYSRATGQLVQQWALPSVWDVGVSPVMDRLYAVSSDGFLGMVDLPNGVMTQTGGAYLTNPYSLDFTESGEFYVTDDLPGNTAGIVLFSPDATTATSWTVPGIEQPRGIVAVEDMGILLVADIAGYVHVVALDGEGTGTVLNSLTNLSYLDSEGGMQETALYRPIELELIGNTVFIGDLGETDGNGFILAFDLVDRTGYVIENPFVDATGGLSGAQPQGAIVPEPATLLLVGAGLAGLATVRRRRK